MWLFTKIGFYSVKSERDQIIVRARRRRDLYNLKRAASIGSEIIETPGRDYPFRIHIIRSEFLCVLVVLAESVDYPDFKAMIEANADQCGKIDSYYKIWLLMRLLPIDPPINDNEGKG
jgi:hypothetical protein